MHGSILFRQSLKSWKINYLKHEMTLINFKTGYPLKKGEKSNGGGVEMGGGSSHGSAMFYFSRPTEI